MSYIASLAEGTTYPTTTAQKIGSTYDYSGIVQLFITRVNGTTNEQGDIYDYQVWLKEKVTASGSQRVVWKTVGYKSSWHETYARPEVVVSPPIMVAHSWDFWIISPQSNPYYCNLQYSIRILR
jgi:hypothetical protein